VRPVLANSARLHAPSPDHRIAAEWKTPTGSLAWRASRAHLACPSSWRRLLFEFGASSSSGQVNSAQARVRQV
jgi:hypothetical protein